MRRGGENIFLVVNRVGGATYHNASLLQQLRAVQFSNSAVKGCRSFPTPLLPLPGMDLTLPGTAPEDEDWIARLLQQGHCELPLDTLEVSPQPSTSLRVLLGCCY